MIRAVSVLRRAAVRPDQTVDSVTLDHDGRQRRRLTLACEGGLDVLLDLERPADIQDGDALRLEDGRLVLVRAAPQRLMEITAGSPLRLARLAWHIGNRHTPAEIGEDAILIEPDHVLAEMVRGLGGAVREVERPFAPERGAYHAHGHG
ncbi:urease accessory protein UreE [Methylopila turkensis]|uniref:Urease accessory protein UreE n=1 Tax=Methylopila turkensis TaxID=1437816 RepID=A0A9W6JMD0_9HYPH|nr:urease accessory protein UreE [Methylopila turkensis]GLK79817.1 urease accessory protein UreE [Methylopila turkensis]